MSQILVNPDSPDLKRLRQEGYNFNIKSAYLILKDVPYVTSNKGVKYDGILVSKLNLAGDLTVRPDDHQAQFIGDFPCHADGTQMLELGNPSNGSTNLGEGLNINHSFSRKPHRGYYNDYYEKMTTYAGLIAGQAQAIDVNAKAQTFRVEEPEDVDCPFNYLDTASSRAEINVATKKLALDRIAIVGLGGTGSYVLDLVVKTPIKEIHLFDADKFSTHNAFRAPGAPSIEELRDQVTKVSYFKGRYSKMHRGLVPHEFFIEASNVEQLKEMKFVFLCIDNGSGKRMVVEKLEEFGVPFIDVGMGVYAKNGVVAGLLRTTTSTVEQRQHVWKNGRISFGNPLADEYDKNIQIADLNALNATFAVIKWKKLFGFYADFEKEFFSHYTIDSNMLVNADML